MSDYVSREVLDAELARQAAEFDKRCAKLEAAFQLQRVKTKKDSELLRSEVSELRTRLGDIKDFTAWVFAALGFGVTALGIIIAALQFFKH